MFFLEIFLMILLAYLIGSLSSAIIVSKLMGLPDPRTKGSGNPGATNVLRIGGKTAAAITLLGDVLKGIVPVLIAKWLSLPSLAIALVAFAAFIGHLWPIFFSFEGGKGVATLFGCLLALAWPAGIFWLGTWLLIALLFRYSSLASMIASIVAPLDIWVITQNMNYTIIVTIMAILLLYRHKSNIANLMAGKESKIGKRKNSS